MVDPRVKRSKKRLVGQKFTVNCGWTCEIVDYFRSTEVLVRWENDGTEQLVRMDVLRSGELKPTNCEIDRSQKRVVEEASKEFVGKEFKVKCGWTCVVDSYEGKNKIQVTWKEDGSKQTTSSESLRNLSTIPKGLKLYGVALNDMKGKPYNVEYLNRWHLMLTRCYTERFQKKNPTYKGVVVCEDWKKFSNFHKWCESWGDIKGLSLDKDNSGNNIYSPENCVFVTSNLNSAMVADPEKSYRFRGGRYEVSCVGKYVGTFDTEKEAVAAYKKAKRKNIEQILEDYRKEDFYDVRTENAILRWCKTNLE